MGMAEGDRISWHPKPGIVAVVDSVNGIPIRLSDERWGHILKGHGELGGFQVELLLTVSRPEAVYRLPPGRGHQFAAVRKFDRLRAFGLSENLVVHYREVSLDDGFILTSYVMSDGRLRGRFRQWTRLT